MTFSPVALWVVEKDWKEGRKKERKKEVYV